MSTSIFLVAVVVVVGMYVDTFGHNSNCTPHRRRPDMPSPAKFVALGVVDVAMGDRVNTLVVATTVFVVAIIRYTPFHTD